VTLSGQVTKSDGTGLDGVVLTFSNGEGNVTSSGGGYYSKTVAYNWSGSVTPSAANGSFSPITRSYVNLTADQPSQVYSWRALANPTISGRVTKSDGTGLDGVVLSFSNGGGTVTTANGGYYSKVVPFGWNGKVTPAYSKVKGSFTPTSRSYSNVTVNKSKQNYGWKKR
jgi:hypothetical protein